MNLYLHGIGGGESPDRGASDALLGAARQTLRRGPDQSALRQEAELPDRRRDGEIDTEREDYEREDFNVTTSNKQLNFLQHIMTILATERRRGRGAARQRAVRRRRAARQSAQRLLDSSTSTRCCACRPASSTSRASRRTCCSSTSKPPRRRPRDEGRCGFTTSAPTSTSR